MYLVSFLVIGDWLCGLCISMMLVEGRVGRFLFLLRMCRLLVSRLCSCMVMVRLVLIIVNSVDRLGLL